MYDEFEERDTIVIAVSQEDASLEDAAGMAGLGADNELRFDIVADLNRTQTRRYDRTTAYLIDREGIVRQIFPMVIHVRPSWVAFLGDIDKVNESTQSGGDEEKSR